MKYWRAKDSDDPSLFVRLVEVPWAEMARWRDAQRQPVSGVPLYWAKFGGGYEVWPDAAFGEVIDDGDAKP